MKTMQQGFTLIELMIVVAIIGILSSVAIPAYREYVAVSHGGASMRGVVNYVAKAQTCIETGVGCANFHADNGAGGGSLVIDAAIAQGVGGDMTWDDGTCSVTATLGPNGDVTYAAVATGGGATNQQCSDGAGL